MKTLYIHSLKSQGLSAEKHQALSSLGLNIVAGTYPFKTVPNLFSTIERDIYEAIPNFIIGSNIGGCMAFYLSNKLNVPALLFNPTLNIQQVQQHQNISASLVKHSRCPFQRFILGEKDTTSNPSETLAFLNLHYPKDEISYKIIKGMEHCVPVDVLVKQTELFINSMMYPLNDDMR